MSFDNMKPKSGLARYVQRRLRKRFPRLVIEARDFVGDEILIMAARDGVQLFRAYEGQFLAIGAGSRAIMDQFYPYPKHTSLKD